MRLVRTILSALLGTATQAAAAEIAPVPLTPPASQLGYTVFALGMIPINANFQDFTGTLTLDPTHPASCQVQVTVRMASLHMADSVRNKLALGPAMLDVAHYPTMRFTGHCEGQSLVGLLTLHGITRNLTLAVQRDGTHVAATGTLQRRDYKVAGLTGLVGQGVRIHLNAQLPPAAAAVIR